MISLHRIEISTARSTHCTLPRSPQPVPTDKCLTGIFRQPQLLPMPETHATVDSDWAAIHKNDRTGELQTMNCLSKLAFAILAALFLIPVYSSANAAPQREHPAYLHALSDLRDARAHLDRHDGGELREQEKKAIHEIND